MKEEQLFFIFFGFWSALGGAGIYLFQIKVWNVRLKRKTLPLFQAFTGLVMMLYMVLAGFPLVILLFAPPIMFLFVLINNRLGLSKFCDVY